MHVRSLTRSVLQSLNTFRLSLLTGFRSILLQSQMTRHCVEQVETGNARMIRG
jgi:hypothetical protein